MSSPARRGRAELYPKRARSVSVQYPECPYRTRDFIKTRRKKESKRQDGKPHGRRPAPIPPPLPGERGARSQGGGRQPTRTSHGRQGPSEETRYNSLLDFDCMLFLLRALEIYLKQRAPTRLLPFHTAGIGFLSYGFVLHSKSSRKTAARCLFANA